MEEKLLREGGFVYTWGQGEMGHKQVDKERICPFPVQVPGLQGIVDVAIGYCTAAVSKSGTLHVWGRENPTPVLQKGIPPLHLVTQVSVGNSHMGCVVSTGLAYTWGKGTHGCLGDGKVDARKEPGLVMLEDLETKALVPMTQIKQIVCGRSTTAAIVSTDTGSALYTWGSNQWGILGLGDDSLASKALPTRVPGLNNVVKASVGSMHAGAITAEGQLYMWGYGGSGCLGQGARTDSCSPMLIALPGVCVDVHASVGFESFLIPQKKDRSDVVGQEQPHTLACTADGALWTWGTGHKGILGNMYHKGLHLSGVGDCLVPYRVGSELCYADSTGKIKPPTSPEPPYLEGRRIIQVSSSAIHSACLSSAGEVWSFGCGAGGRMGVRAFEFGLTGARSRMKCYVMKPTVVEKLQEANIFVGKIDTARSRMVAIGLPKQ